VAGLVGSGRSEMAKTIFGVDEAVEAKITLNGQSINFTNPRDAINHGVYLIPEDRRSCGLVVDFNVRENISLPNLESYASGKIINTKKETEAALKAVKSINIKTPSPEMRAANLSGGNQQKVVLARWLTFSPKVIIFDEPTRGIDVGAKAEILETMRRLAADGLAVVFASSELEEIEAAATRVLVMARGQIAANLSGAEMTPEAITSAASATPRDMDHLDG